MLHRVNAYSALYSDLDWQYNNSLSGPYIDLSDKTDDGETVAGLKDGRITGAWRPMVCVGSEKYQKSEIQRLWDISQNIYYMDFLIYGELSEVSRFLLKKGYVARPVYTQIVDLTKSQEELHADLRKSYKSLVNKNNGLSINNMAEFRNGHELRKNKKRSDKSWELQKLMEHLVCVQYGLDTSGALFYHNNYTAYYASAFGENNHACLWYLLMWAKNIGCKTLELGEQVYHEGQIMMDGKPATEKHVNISAFKKGFGGRTVTRLILENT